ncbi:MAG: hypothetical protein WAK12_09320 [Acidimicrobiales bacterium]
MFVIAATSGSSELLFFLIGVVIPLWALANAAATPSSTFRAANSSKVLWIIMPLLFGFIAACIYFFFIRPRLRRATRL